MYTRASTDRMKSRVIARFSQVRSTLRVVIATTAFSMGIDIPDVREIVHWGPPCNLKQYVQEIGRAGRDGENAQAILLYEKAGRYVVRSMTECRRLNLFKHYIEYCHSDHHTKCRCCDICVQICNCKT